MAFPWKNARCNTSIYAVILCYHILGVACFWSSRCINIPQPCFNRALSKPTRADSSVLGTRGEEEIFKDDEESEEPYGNRSLAWTKRYRKLISYESARHRAIGLGLRSKEEWDEYIEEGSGEHGAYLLNRPDEMYREDWVSWEEFLGAMRSYDDTRHIVQNVLKLKTMEQYRNFVKSDTRRAEGLRIPAKPEIEYKDKGWIDDDNFFNPVRQCQ